MTSISAASTDAQYPTAKLAYDQLALKANIAGQVFTGAISATNLSNTNTGDETTATIKTKLGTASGTTDGYLTSADWTTFNAKQNALVNSAGLAGALSDENGSGTVVFSTNAVLTTPNIGAATGASLSATGAVSGSQIISTIADGTAPFIVNSKTQVANLTATTARNISNGAGGEIPYQSAANTTEMLTNGTAGQVLTSQGGTNSPVWKTVGLSNIVVFESGSGDYSVPPGVTFIEVELIGGGGGGAGGIAGAGSTADMSIAGGGGGGGAYTKIGIPTSFGATYAYQIGTGGLGSNTNTAGGNGGQTTFNMTISANGGLGGTNMNSGSSTASSPGGAGGSAGTSGQINIPGGYGGFGYRLVATIGYSGTGGSSQYGYITTNIDIPVANGNNAGINGSSYGSGGSGGTAFDTSGGSETCTGGNGADGVIIIHEYR